MTDRNRRLDRLERQIPEPEEPGWNFSELSDAELDELEDLTKKEDSGAELTSEEQDRLRQIEAQCTETPKDRTRIEIYSPGPDGPILKRRVSLPSGTPVNRPYAHLSNEELAQAIFKAEARQARRPSLRSAWARNSSEEQGP